MVAKLLYSNPTIKSYELQYHTQVKECLLIVNVSNELLTDHVYKKKAIDFLTES